MPLEVVLVDGINNQALHSEQAFDEEGRILLTSSFGAMHGVFKAVERTSVGTTTVASPFAGGSIVLTDIIVSSDKAANSSVVLQFDDDTNTELIFKGDSVNAPVTLGHSIAGRWQGWVGARLDVVTVGAVDVTVSVGYVKLKTGLSYSEWDSMR